MLQGGKKYFVNIPLVLQVLVLIISHSRNYVSKMCSVAVSQELPGKREYKMKQDWSNYNNILKLPLLSVSKHVRVLEASTGHSIEIPTHTYYLYALLWVILTSSRQTDISSQLSLLKINSKSLDSTGQTFSLCLTFLTLFGNPLLVQGMSVQILLQTLTVKRYQVSPLWVFSLPTQIRSLDFEAPGMEK